MPDWKRIKAEYIRGGTSYRKLAEKHGVSFGSIKRVAVREKWTELRERSEEKATQKIVESVADRGARRADKFDAVADMLLDKILEFVSSGLVIDSPRGFRDVTGAIKDLRDIKGLKSELDMQEQIARIEKLRKEAKEEDTNREITVVFGDGVEDFGK